MSKITVYDAIMGSGKTYDAIERMKHYLKDGKKFIYITPFKDEIKRVLIALDSNNAFAPLDPDETGAYEGELDLVNEDGTWDLNSSTIYKYNNKRTQFLKMVSEGKNVISTHALFLGLKREDYEIFRDYILILDEVVTPLKTHKIGARDINILKEQGLIVIDDNNQVRFIDDEYDDPGFRQVKKICNNSTVFYLDKYFFVWVFPIEIFKQFKEVQILTYLFEGSLLAPYFKMYEIDYGIIKNDSCKELDNYKSLLHIYLGKANNVLGNNSFSKTWIDNLSKSNAKKLTFTTSNVFRRVFNTKSDENAYTTFKPHRAKLAGKCYTKGFIAINARASNNFSHKKSMAYLGNRYFDPQTLNFFRERGIDLNEDLWALSELIQWIWRGCIRNQEKMNLFIPNHRMRKLLIDWLDGKYLIESTSLKKIG
ncbi:hypothetical protein E1J38_013355 [Seonamhaeicola sediminis]|uniref:Helicase/UvrB N-terminal domain-containing protein n=1 Tax=Seonamhaeicola sediminis TaxID=2528206 RepID=A0A562YBQ1_9FLAO|nr:hypothetical protein [Seonamhaeicola sediminis]TWO31505.1 hypothetical protein E1J38_013355 [Seonamhaeicola sediminis]